MEKNYQLQSMDQLLLEKVRLLKLLQKSSITYMWIQVQCTGP